MKIDIKDYLMEYIGDIDWYGESYHDDQSLKNMDKATSYVEQHVITVTDGTITTNKRELLDILKRWEINEIWNTRYKR